MQRTTRNVLVRLSSGAALALTLVLGLAACDVDKTQEGKMPDVDIQAESGQLPEYEQVEETKLPTLDVDVEEGRLPKYDIDAPEVTVSLKERTVTVPKLIVVTEEEQMKVPHIGIDFPDEGETERTVDVEVEVPSAAYDLRIQRVYLLNDRYLVVSRLESPATPTRDEITRVTDHVVITGPELPVKHIIIGKKPNRRYNDRYVFVSERQEIEETLSSGQLLYDRELHTEAGEDQETLT